MVSVGGHAYRKDIRQAAYRFINTHLKGDAAAGRPTARSTSSAKGSKPGPYPIPPEKLRVFPTDADIPADQLNTKIDESFVPMAKPCAARGGQVRGVEEAALSELKRVSFGYFPEKIEAASPLSGGSNPDELTMRLTSEEGIEFRVRNPEPNKQSMGAKGILLIVLNENEAGTTPEWVKKITTADRAVVLCEPRGIGATRWTRKDPPNYVERSHVLLGRTVDAGRVWDVIAAAKFAASESRQLASNSQPASDKLSIHVAGSGRRRPNRGLRSRADVRHRKRHAYRPAGIAHGQSRAAISQRTPRLRRA